MTQGTTGAHSGEGVQEPAAQTTSISLTSLAPVPSDQALTEEQLEAIAALPARTALLVAQSGPNQGARYLLDEDVTTVGRHPEADIFLDDVTVSRRHAEFRRTDAGFDVADCNSLNGTFVNGDRVDQVTLRNGMKVQVGKFRLTYYTAQQQS
ncbi:MAG: FHA domain-containing protein [Micrococcus sp.]|nr:FHA domain-containing protein [Micrococcus sp.]